MDATGRYLVLPSFGNEKETRVHGDAQEQVMVIDRRNETKRDPNSDETARYLVLPSFECRVPWRPRGGASSPPIPAKKKTAQALETVVKETYLLQGANNWWLLWLTTIP